MYAKNQNQPQIAGNMRWQHRSAIAAPTAAAAPTAVPNQLLKNHIFSLHYTEPAEKTMAVILVYYNVQSSLRLIQNILYVKHLFDLAHIPYFIGELSIQGSPFIFTENAANVFHFSTDDIMFYKENIINLVEPRLPATYTKLCVMDADILFENPDWYTLMSAQLNNVQICQPFSEAHWLNLSYNEIIRYKASFLKNRIDGHEGFVWGFQRDWFHANKLPESGFIGVGDTMFVKAVFNKTILAAHQYVHRILTAYIARVPSDISAAYLDLKIYHLYHGTIANRKYSSRHVKIGEVLDRLHVAEIDECIDFQPDGIMKWKAPVRETLNAFMKEYLCQRDDDGA